MKLFCSRYMQADSSLLTWDGHDANHIHLVENGRQRNAHAALQRRLRGLPSRGPQRQQLLYPVLPCVALGSLSSHLLASA